MQSYSSTQQICGTCNHWRGDRAMDECQFVYVDPDTVGLCAISNTIHTPGRACAGALQWERDSHNRPHGEANCWEYTACGFEQGGPNALKHGTCPAYPNHGRSCTALAETKCQLGHNAATGRLPIPRERNCRQCAFFNNVLSLAD